MFPLCGLYQTARARRWIRVENGRALLQGGPSGTDRFTDLFNLNSVKFGYGYSCLKKTTLYSLKKIKNDPKIIIMICLSKSVKPCFVYQDTAEKETGWQYLYDKECQFLLLLLQRKKVKSFKTFKNNFLILLKKINIFSWTFFSTTSPLWMKWSSRKRRTTTIR